MIKYNLFEKFHLIIIMGQLICFFRSCSISIHFHSNWTEMEQQWNKNGTGIEQKWNRNSMEIEDGQWMLSSGCLACYMIVYIQAGSPKPSFYCPSSISIPFLFNIFVSNKCQLVSYKNIIRNRAIVAYPRNVYISNKAFEGHAWPTLTCIYTLRSRINVQHIIKVYDIT